MFDRAPSPTFAHAPLVGLFAPIALFALGCPTYEPLRWVDCDEEPESEFCVDTDGADSDATDSDAGDGRVTDTFLPPEAPMADILWVIDDSGSMCDKQAQLAQAFPMFMEYFLDSGLDYHIGVTSMDTTSSGLNGRLRAVGPERYITPETPNPVEVFAQMARLGCSGSPVKNGSIAAYNAIQQPTPLQQEANAGFLRDDASLHIIALTDEPDNSYFPSVGWSFSVTEFINWLNGFKGDPEITVSFSAIAGPVPNGCTRGGFPPSIAEASVPYPFISDEVGRRSPDEDSPGKFFSICEEDWEPFLEEIAEIAGSVPRSFYLQEAPRVPSLSVEIETADGDTLHGIHWIDLPEDFDTEDVEAICQTLEKTRCVVFAYFAVTNEIRFLDHRVMPGDTVRVSYRPRQDQGAPEGGG